MKTTSCDLCTKEVFHSDGQPYGSSSNYLSLMVPNKSHNKTIELFITATEWQGLDKVGAGVGNDLDLCLECCHYFFKKWKALQNEKG